MPRVSFTEENIKKNDFDYPKLKMKKGDVARIVLLEEPAVEYVHNIRKPKMNGGVPAKEIKTRRDDTQYEDFKYEFVSRPICLGDYATLESQGSDPDRCPICREATRSDKFAAPTRRFALHVVKYETQPGKTAVKEPFQATTLIWAFTDKVFSKLYEFQLEWGNLKEHDLIVKCENEVFQNYDLQVASTAEWMKGDDRVKTIKAVFAPENLAPDLAIFCGSKKTEKQLEYDIKAVNEVWAIINGAAASPTDSLLSSVGSSDSLASSANDLLSGNSSTETTEDKWADSPEADAEVEKARAESKPASTSDLDALLNGI